MNNINNNFDIIASSAEEAVDWINKNADAEPQLKESKNDLTVELCQLYNSSKATYEVIPCRTTIGVFGASQAGKSYLISSLCAAENGDFTTEWDGKKISFMSHINPIGNDKEATGVVTRFRHTKNTGLKGYPVEIRVFSEIEVVICLANSYFNDFEDTRKTNPCDNLLKADHYDSLFDECKAHIKDDYISVIKEADVVYLADYLKHHSKGSLYGQEPTSDFWQKARYYLPKIPLEQRIKIYSLLWGKLKVFSILFEKIAKELLKINGVSTVYAPTEVFAKLDASGQLIQREITINNVAALDEILVNNETINVSLDLEGKNIANINFACLASVALEILFPLEKSSSVDKFDLLDFPGCRAREAKSMNNAKEEELKCSRGAVTTQLIQLGGYLIRRGKVAYLFDRYNLRHEVDVLLFCINSSSQLEVTSLVTLLNEWINENVGETPEKRQASNFNTLVGFLTRFDQTVTKDLNRQVGTPSAASKVISDALQKFSDQKWLNSWHPGKVHDQFFIVRKPNMPDNGVWIKYGQNNVELDYREDNLAKLNEFKANLKTDPSFKHIYMGEETVEEVFKLQSGGASWAGKFLTQNFANDELDAECKARKIKKSKMLLDDVIAKLNLFAHRSGHLAQKKLKESAIEIQKSIEQCNRVAHIFGDLREKFELSDDSLESLYAQFFNESTDSDKMFASKVFDLWKSNLDSLSDGESFTEILSIIKNAWFNSWYKVAQHQFDTPENRNSFSFFYNAKEQRFISMADEKLLQEKLKILLRKLASEMISAASSQTVNLTQKIYEELRDVKSDGSTKEALLRQRISRVQRVISDYNTYLSAEPNSIHHKLFSCDNERDDRSLFSETFEISLGLPKLTTELIRDYDIHYRNDFFSSLADLMINVNSMADNKLNISSAANDQLCEILDRFEGK